MNETLVAVGDNCLDVYLTYDRLAVGGNALNVAVQWRRDGRPARYLGAVGDDPEAGIVIEEVVAAGLDRADVERRVGQTGVTLLSHESGDRSFLLEDLGVGDRYEPPEAAFVDLEQARWVHLGTNSSPALVRELVARGVQFSVDISTAPDPLLVAGAPLVFASGPEESREPVQPLIESLLATGAQRVVVTCGRRGAFFAGGGELVHQPAVDVDVLDTCGAGDNFIATFVTAFCCDRLDEAESLRRAAVAAAQTCTYVGGFPQHARPVPDWLLAKYARHTAPVLDAKGQS